MFAGNFQRDNSNYVPLLISKPVVQYHEQNRQLDQSNQQHNKHTPPNVNNEDNANDDDYCDELRERETHKSITSQTISETVTSRDKFVKDNTLEHNYLLITYDAKRSTV